MPIIAHETLFLFFKGLLIVKEIGAATETVKEKETATDSAGNTTPDPDQGHLFGAKSMKDLLSLVS